MSTPDSETRLRELLSSVAPPPPRVTTAGVLQAGQRTRRRRRQMLVTGTAGLLTLGIGSAVGLTTLAAGPNGEAPGLSPQVGTAPVAAPISCAVERLTLPAGATGGEVNDGSPNGRYLAGFSSGGKGTAKPVRWDGTKAEAIPVNGIGEAQGVNDNGVVVGESSADGRSFAWAYADGKVVELPLPAGYTGAEAYAVNAAGQVSGVLFAGDKVTAVVWRGTAATAEVDVLDAPGDATAFGISNAGVVVGGLNDGSSAYRWDANGQGGRLDSPTGTRAGSAQGIRGDWAYGLFSKAGEGNVALPPPSPGADETPQVVRGWTGSVLWNLRTGESATVDDSEVQAVNAAGQAVVNHTDKTASVRDTDGELRALPGLGKQQPTYAYALSDDGLRIGGASGGTPVRWACSGEVK